MRGSVGTKPAASGMTQLDAIPGDAFQPELGRAGGETEMDRDVGPELGADRLEPLGHRAVGHFQHLGAKLGHAGA